MTAGASTMIYRSRILLNAGHRFADRVLSYTAQKSNLSLLMESYLYTMRDLGAETWIMHGTLMGWWWNRKVV